MATVTKYTREVTKPVTEDVYILEVSEDQARYIHAFLGISNSAIIEATGGVTGEIYSVYDALDEALGEPDNVVFDNLRNAIKDRYNL